MIDFDPPISVCPLAAAEAGSLIQLDGVTGFVAITSQDPHTRVFVSLDRQASQFRFQIFNQDLQVISFGSTLKLQPIHSSFEAEYSPGRNTKTEMLFYSGAPHLMVHLPDRNTRIFDLSSGELRSGQSHLCSAFKKWAVGVQTNALKFQPLIVVGDENAVVESPTKP